MSPSDLTDVAQKMAEERFPAGAAIIRQGESGEKFYVIAAGRAEVRRTAEGSAPAVAILGAGGFFGEVALLRDQPRNATVVALEPVVAYTLAKADFLGALRTHKSFEDQISAQLFHRG